MLFSISSVYHDENRKINQLKRPIEQKKRYSEGLEMIEKANKGKIYFDFGTNSYSIVCHSWHKYLSDTMSTSVVNDEKIVIDPSDASK